MTAKALFLDRDGIINIDTGYVSSTDKIKFVSGISELLRTAVQKGYLLIVVTNQSGIARGMYTAKEVDEVHQYISDHFLKDGIKIDDYFHCPHHPDFSGECDCRKPMPGMLKDASEKHSINLKESLIIGDKQSDVKAGKNAGLAGCILVKSKYESAKVPEADYFANDLHEAAELIREYF